MNTDRGQQENTQLVHGADAGMAPWVFVGVVFILVILIVLAGFGAWCLLNGIGR